MGCPSVCCESVLLPLVNKEGALAHSINRISVGNPNKDTGKKKTESGGCQQPWEKQDVR